MSLFDVLVKGGWIMLPIVLSSIVVVALGISRFLVLRRTNLEFSKFLDIWSSGEAGELSRFKAACRMGPEVMRKMLLLFEGGNNNSDDVRQGVESAGRQELNNLETGLGTIATLAAITPLIGFLGTVTGMIRAFMQIQNLGGNVNANVLAGGIWEALVTTAAGLAVGILALVIYNYLTSLVKRSAQMIENCGELIIRKMSGNHHET